MDVEVLLFDIGGTVFDWRSAMNNTLESIDSINASAVDIDGFSATWRKQSLIEVEEVAFSQAKWRPFDEVLHASLDRTLTELGVVKISSSEKADLIRAWEHMPAWPEARAALALLRKKYYIAPLTILSFRAASFSSRSAGINWDSIISCDTLKAMKPGDESYMRALELLQRSPESVCFVAAHPNDLRAASSHGMKTAYVAARLHDYGDDYDDKGFAGEFDLVANDFTELAKQIGCQDNNGGCLLISSSAAKNSMQSGVRRLHE